MRTNDLTGIAMKVMTVNCQHRVNMKTKVPMNIIVLRRKTLKFRAAIKKNTTESCRAKPVFRINSPTVSDTVWQSADSRDVMSPAKG